MFEARKILYQKLHHQPPKKLIADGCTKAAVSLTLQNNNSSEKSLELLKPLDLLLMQRAYNDDDPWSGQISFPGGRFEQNDTSMQATAERETQEEMGFQLQATNFIGQLDDTLGPIISNKKTLHISSFVYLLEEMPTINSNHEVEQIIWVSLNDLLDPDRRISFVHPSVDSLTMQGIRLDALSRDGEALILWGLTLYLLEHLFGILELK